MKVPGKCTSFCVVPFLALNSVAAVRRLNSINDLKEINFGQSVPKHSLLLLYWFASVVNTDRNYVMQLPFDPNSEHYGSHHYGNYDNLLRQLPHGHRYYTLGNLNQGTTGRLHLPQYVVHPKAGYDGENRDRIIVSIRKQYSGWNMMHIIDQVYITQHYGNSVDGTYDPRHTYEISTNLLRQIRQFSGGTNLRELSNRFGSNINEFQLSDIRNTWGQLAGLGLLVFIVMQGRRFSFLEQNSTLQSSRHRQPYVQNRFHECQRNWDPECGIIVVALLFILAFLLCLPSVIPSYIK